MPSRSPAEAQEQERYAWRGGGGGRVVIEAAVCRYEATQTQKKNTPHQHKADEGCRYATKSPSCLDTPHSSMDHQQIYF